MMNAEIVHALDEAALRVFAEKGSQGEASVPQQGQANALKVRRIMQLTRDLTRGDVAELRILDLACGEGVYAIEAGLRGGQVVAIDGRTARMDEGAAIARRLGLSRIRFEQGDIRHVTVATHGQFDVVYCLGILYHLDSLDVFRVLEHVRDLARQLVVIDTHVALEADAAAEYQGRRYRGSRHREHGDTDSEATRRGRVLMSLDNTFSFWFTRADLIRLLVDVGFTTVMEIHGPLEPGKPANRVTLVATTGARVAVSAYPWINGLSEDAIATAVAAASGASRPQERPSRQRRGLGGLVNGVLRRTVGVELRRAR
jgi:SAM-dependent methyltransferase